MKKQNLFYAKQARTYMRSAAKLSAILLCGAIGAAAVWGFRWQSKTLLVVAAYFAFDAWRELRTARRRERAAAMESSSSLKARTATPDDEFRTLPDGEWRERTIIVEGRPVSVRVSTAPRVLEQALTHATALCADPDLLGTRFREFKAAEAALNTDWGAETEGLEIDSIDFVSPEHPNSAEVSFTVASGGETWTCLLVDGEFRDLSMAG